MYGDKPMLRPEVMRKITIFVHKNDRDILLETLHKTGVLQIRELKKDEASRYLAPALPPEELKTISDYLLRVSRLISIMKIPPQKTSFVQSMFGLDLPEKVKIKHNSKREVLRLTEAYIKKNEEELIRIEERHAEIAERLDELKGLKEAALIIQGAQLNTILISELRRVKVVAGIIAKQNLPKLREESGKELSISHLMGKSIDKKRELYVLISLSDEYARAVFISKKHGADIIPLDSMPKSSNPKDELDKEERELLKEKDELINRIIALRKESFEEAVILREELEILKERDEQNYNLLSSKNFIMLSGWVPKKRVIPLKTRLREEFKGRVVMKVDFPEDNDETPVKLSNPAFIKPYEMITELFSLPKYKDIDPTFIVGPVFIIFAGFMLTDFVYGAMLVILALFLIKRLGKYSSSMKEMGTILLWMGIFAMIFGFLTGSYLGDLPSYLFGISPKSLAIWKDPLSEPLYFLILSFIVALIHLNIGLVIGALEDIRKKDYKTLVKERGTWFLLQLSVLFFFFPKITWLAETLLGIDVLLILVFNGPLGILGMTGFMGDVISYSRLFALALSTAGIALTVNLLSNLVKGVPFVGILIAIPLFIVGHFFSFVMNSLGAFVHSIRLQFVEFFGKFYEGGGEKFTPFKEERLYTEVKRG